MDLISLIRPMASKGRMFVVRNASHILMGLGTSGTLAALIFTAKNTPEAWNAKADAVIEKTAKRDGCDFAEAEYNIVNRKTEEARLTPWELVKTCWKYYGAAAAMELLALICFWGAHGIDIHRQVVLAGVASTAEEALRQYQKKVQDMIGEKAEKEVHNALAQDEIDRTQPKTTVIFGDDSEQWFIIHGQRFRSTWYKVKNAEVMANHHLIQYMYLSETELFWLLDPDKRWLEPLDDSGEVGWCVDKMLELSIDWGEDPDHRPVGVIVYRDKDGFRYDPRPGYSKGL